MFWYFTFFYILSVCSTKQQHVLIWQRMFTNVQSQIIVWRHWVYNRWNSNFPQSFLFFVAASFFAELRSPFTFSPSFTRTHTKPPHLLKSGCTAKKMLIQSTGGSLKRLTLSEALKTLAHTYAQAISHAWQRLGFVATFMSVCLSVYVCLSVFLCLFACDPPT